MSAIGERPVPSAAIRRAAPTELLAAWAPVAVWMAIIFSLSSDRFSDVHSAEWLSSIFGTFGIPPAVVGVGNLIVRKTAHFVEYAVLGLLAFRAARATWPRHRGWQPLAIALGLAVVCAILDELHQYVMTATRTGTVRDVMVDSAGALAAVAYLFQLRARGRSA